MRRCLKCSQPAVVIPTVVVPIENHSIPAYLQLREGLCRNHAAAFTLKDYTDYDGSWYDMVRADLESMMSERREYTEKDLVVDSRGFVIPTEPTGPAYQVKSPYKVAAMEKCRLEMWDIRTVEAVGMKQKLFPDMSL